MTHEERQEVIKNLEETVVDLKKKIVDQKITDLIIKDDGDELCIILQNGKSLTVSIEYYCEDSYLQIDE